MKLHVAISQFRPVKGDPERSLDGIEEVLGRATALRPRPDVVVFPEAALTGYFLEGGVRDLAWPASRVFDALRERYAGAADPARPLDIVLGFFEVHARQVYNAALYARLGGPDPRILHVHRKVFLPTYGVFQEQRFVQAGDGIRAFDTRWGRAGLLICEDAWHSVSPALAALDGAEVIFIPSASPARGTRPGPGVPGNLERWDRLAAGIAQEHGLHVVVSQLVGFEGGKGFPGGSVVYGPRGGRQARGPLWRPALLPVSLEMEEILSVRVEEPLLADLEEAWPRLLRHSPGARRAAAAAGSDGEPVEREGADGPEGREGDGPAAGPGAPGPETAEGPRPEGGTDSGAGLPPIPDGGDARGRGPEPDDAGPLAIDTELVEEWLVEFLRGEIRRRRGFEHVVVGISGGVDSSLTATLCARALGPDAVTGFLLPYRTSSPESREHALRLAEHLGIETETISITGAVDGYLEEHEPDASAHRRGNVAARQRMIVLFDQAAKRRALPVGTGNKSERLLGYFTWHADDSPPINPLGDLFKVQVWELARAMGVPEEIVEKPATADLVRGQTDEDDLGISYPEADLILYWLLRGWAADGLEEQGFDRSSIDIVHARLASTHWKRHLPTVAMLSSTTIGEWYLRPVDY